jgi:hypothetical protein
VWDSIARHAIVGSLFFLPRERRKAIDRRLRGREEYRKLHDADWLLVSWGKSGRTWLRVMLSRFYQLRFGLEEHELLDFDNLHKRNAAIPKVFFTHGNYLRDYTGHGYDTKVDFHGKRIVFLVRDPRDVAVSQFFQWKYRMRPHKKWLNDYPPHGSDISLFNFMMEPEQGLPRVISYFNGWLRGIPEVGEVLVVRYEDMRVDPGAVLARILEFTGIPGTAAEIADAVDFAAYDNLKKMEEKQSFSLWRPGWRLVPGDRKNPDSFKVRRAKVGGYRDYFSDEELARIEAMVDADLLPQLGYTSAETGQQSVSVAAGQDG